MPKHLLILIGSGAALILAVTLGFHQLSSSPEVVTAPVSPNIPISPNTRNLPPDLPELITDGEMVAEGDATACDLDLDGDCDAVDFEILRRAFGKCLGEDGYDVAADADADGCVTERDLKQLFLVPPKR